MCHTRDLTRDNNKILQKKKKEVDTMDLTHGNKKFLQK